MIRGDGGQLILRHRVFGPALVVAALMLSACSSQASVVSVSPSVPAGLDAIPSTPLPGERNGIEAMPSPIVMSAILTAVEAETSVEVEGTMERVATQEDGSVLRTPFDFAFSGAERAYEASATWNATTVALTRRGDELWLAADARYAEEVGRPDAVGLCLAQDDELRDSWAWLDGVDGILTTLMEGAELGGATLDEGERLATFQVVAGGTVVGELEVSAIGSPLPSRLTLEDPSGAAVVEMTEWSAILEPETTGCGGIETTDANE